MPNRTILIILIFAFPTLSPCVTLNFEKLTSSKKSYYMNETIVLSMDVESTRETSALFLDGSIACPETVDSPPVQQGQHPSSGVVAQDVKFFMKCEISQPAKDFIGMHQLCWRAPSEKPGLCVSI